jgi:hypothetical protein
MDLVFALYSNLIIHAWYIITALLDLMRLHIDYNLIDKMLETRSKLKWAFPFCEKYDQIKETPLK